MNYMNCSGSARQGARTRSGNTGASRSAGLAAVIPVAASVLLAALPGGAQTWTQVTSNTVEDLVSVVYSTASTAAAVGKNSATVVSGNGGSTWTDKTVGTLNGTPDLKAVFSNGVTIAAVGKDQTGADPWAVIASGDRGATWAEITNVPATNEDLNDGLFVSATNAVAVENSNIGQVLLSVDRGASWTNPGGFNATDQLEAVASRSSLVIAVGKSEAIARSTNLGVAWANASSVAGTGVDLKDVVVVSATTAVAVGKTGKIVRSTDSGDRWQNPFTAADDLEAVDSSGDNLVAVGKTGTIVISADAGATWSTPTTNPTAVDLKGVRFLTGAIVLAVGKTGTIIGSTDRGDNWTAQTSTTTQDLEEIAFNGISKTLVVGKTGTILLSLDQISVSAPIPFRSKGLLVLLLLGAGLVALRRLRPAP